MKKIGFIIIACCITSLKVAAQQDKPQTPKRPANEIVQAINPFEQDTIKGNAGKYVFFVPGAESCASGMKGIALTNTSDKVVMTRIEVVTKYSGHTSKKILTVDNVSPDEKRTVGCYGCSDKSLYTTCSTYRVLSAEFKQ